MPKITTNNEKHDWPWVKFLLLLLIFLAVIGIGGYELSTRVLGQHYGVERQRGTHEDNITSISKIAQEVENACKQYGSLAACTESKALSDDAIELLNLATQRRMASLTEGTLDVGILQLWLTGAAFVLLIVTVYQTGGTLKEAQQAARFATRSANAAEISERAHLYGGARIKFGTRKATYMDNVVAVMAPGHETPDFYEDRSKVVLEFWIKNYGKTPAFRSSCEIHSLLEDHTDIQRLYGGSGMGAISSGDVHDVFNIEMDTFDFLQLIKDKPVRNPKFIISIDYFDVFQLKQGPSATVVEVYFEDKPEASFELIESEAMLEQAGGIEQAQNTRLFHLIEPKVRLLQNTGNNNKGP